MAGVSLAIAFFLDLVQKYSLLKCFAVLPFGFFLVTRNRPAEILGVFQRGYSEVTWKKTAAKPNNVL